MPSLVRIFSDLHFGDRASRLSAPDALAPLFEGADRIVLNGDTLDTRPSPFPDDSVALRDTITEFFARRAPSAVLLTGNHDPDVSPTHALEFADRAVYVTHGDILFDDIVPWGRDAAVLRAAIADGFSSLPPDARDRLEERFTVFRRAAACVPQRHQAEKHGLRYLVGLAADTVWPPTRVLHVLRAWRETPALAAALVARHQLPARFFVMGHTHRLGAVRTPGGLVVVNTGSFCAPSDPGVVDITDTHLVLRRVDRRGGEFRLGAALAAFSLARS